MKFNVEFSPKFTEEGDLFKTQLDFPGVRPRDLKVRCDGKSVFVDTPENSALVHLPKGVEPEAAAAEYVFGRLFIDVTPRKVKPFVVEVSVAQE